MTVTLLGVTVTRLSVNVSYATWWVSAECPYYRPVGGVWVLLAEVGRLVYPGMYRVWYTRVGRWVYTGWYIPG